MKITHYLQGQPCWAELACHDLAAAQDFYCRLFGWETADMPSTRGDFCLFNLEGDDLGAMYQLPEAMAALPTHWNLYFAVDDLEACIARVSAAGGSLKMGPHTVAEAGTMAQFSDPEGAVFAVWQAHHHIGAKRMGEHGTLCWVELASRDPAGAKDFYARVFGWHTRVAAMADFDYTEWLVGEQAVGGMMEMTERWGQVPPHWMLYFTVDDCDAMLAKIAELGGSVCVPATDIPEVGRFAVVSDPQGGMFSIIALLAA
ncbi:VOC family protein [Shewanella salipaludis]|uniref:VOC family protein n=1 Tax=Shewanella salipaludis TaxID=2723052 RepID=A0A972FRV5_9GAMM|nr:VOC family protein [Shewanella salipaludis]NMH65043.1 VOC family protein [Shewanella salipaludis]